MEATIGSYLHNRCVCMGSPSVFNRRKHRDDTGTFKLFVTDRTKPFVVDSIRRLLKDPLGSVVVDEVELDRRIDPAFEANRLANRTQEPLANAENPVAVVPIQRCCETTRLPKGCSY